MVLIRIGRYEPGYVNTHYFTALSRCDDYEAGKEVFGRRKSVLVVPV